MISRVPFYPALFAILPVFALYASNADLFPLAQLWRPVIVVVVASAVLTAVLSLVLRSAVRGGAAALVAILAHYAYSTFAGWVSSETESSAALVYWLIASLLLIALAAWKVRVLRGFNVLALAMTVVAVGQVTYARNSVSRAAAAERSQVAANAKPKENLPDIYYIVLDGYGRTDQLERALGYSNRDFIEELEERGFFVAKRSVPNYCQTQLSVFSSVNMDYIQSLLPKLDKNSDDRTPIVNGIRESAVASAFRSCGYRVMGIGSGFPGVPFATDDLSVVSRPGLTLLETYLLQMTPFGATQRAVESLFDAHRNRALTAFETLEELDKPAATPRLVFVHILAPRPPFAFDRDGNPGKRLGGYTIADASLLLNGITADQYKEGYADQATFINRRLLQMIDRLLAGHPDPPIIILQGDHGSKVGFDMESLEKTDLKEAFSILNALLVPDSIRARLTDELAPVNTFRIIASDLLGLDLPLRPARAYYSTHNRPFVFTDVTDRVR